MSIKYPIKGFGAKQLYQINQSGNSGWYPIARNNFWHGGINLNFGDDDSGNKPIRAIAKGKIVAYRFTNDFFPLTKTFDDGEDKNLKYYDKKYSHNFVLIKHKHEPANSPAIEYYSLYMHLAPFKVYDSKYDKKQVSIFKRWKCKINTSKDGNGANLRNRTGVKIGVIPNGAVVTERPDPDSSEGYVNNKAKYNYIYVSSRFGDGYISEKICLDGIPGKPGVYRCKVTGASYPADKKGLNVYETPSKASEVVEIIPKGKEFYFVEPYKFISKTGVISPGMAAVKKTINGSSIGFIEVSSSTIKKVAKVIDPVLSDSVQKCDIDIAAGEIIGWPGKDGVADKNSFHFEIFTKNESIFGSNGFWKLKNDQGKPGSVYKLAKNTSFQFRKKNEPLSGKKLLENTVLELVGSPDSYGTFPKANARQVKIVKKQEGWVLKSELDWIESTGDEIGKTQYHLKGSSLKWFWKIKPASKSSKRDIYMGLRNTYNGEKVKLLLLEKGKAGTEQVRKVRYSITPVNDFNGWLANENDIAGLKFTDGVTKKRFYVKKNINSLYSSNPEHAVFKPSSNLAKNDFYILKKDCITDKDKEGKVWIGFPKESITKGDLFFDKDEYDDIDNWLWLKSDSGSIKKRNIFDWKEFFTKCSESSFSSGQDGFCDEPTLFEYIDANKDGEFGEVEIKEAVKHKTVKHKIRKLVCEHPSEWYKPSTGDMENIWGKRLKGPPTKPEEDWYKRIMKKIEAIKGSSKPPKYGFNFSEKKYKAFQEVVEKTCFLDQVDGFTANEKLWHFHPVAFVQHLKRIFEGDSTVTKAQLKAIVPKIKNSDLDKYIAPLNKAFVNYDITSRLEQAHFISQVAQESANFSKTKESYNWNEDLYFSYLDPEPEKTVDLLTATTNPTLAQFLKKMNKTFRKNKTKFTKSTYKKWASKRAKRNGNITHGDGPLFRGRGLIHLTWRTNYTKYAEFRQHKYGETGDIDRSYLKNLAEKITNDPEYAIDSACWFWCNYGGYVDGKYVTGKTLITKKGTVKAFTKMVNGGKHGLEGRKQVFKQAYSVFELTGIHGDVSLFLRDSYFNSTIK